MTEDEEHATRGLRRCPAMENVRVVTREMQEQLGKVFTGVVTGVIPGNGLNKSRSFAYGQLC
jgi:hypothetical protein